MATPEQNALLAMQLFQQPAQQFNQQNDQRTNLLLQLTNRNREEQLKRQLADQSYQRSIELATMQGDREDARATAAGARQLTQLEALQTQKNAVDDAREARQKTDLDAREARALQAEFAKVYQLYAGAARRAEKEVNKLTDYENTWEGLAQLQSDLEDAKVEYEQAGKKKSAAIMAGDVAEVKTALERTKNRMLELSAPSPDDEKFAKTRAVTALKQAIDRGDFESTKKVGKDAIAKGLAALAKDEPETAARFLGKAADEILSAYDGAVEQTLMALPNQKARMAEKQQVNQQFLALQSQLGRVMSENRRAAAVNPYLAEELVKQSNGLEQLMTPVQEAPRQRTLDQIFQKPTAASGAATSGPTGTTATAAPSMDENALFSGISQLGIPGERPMVQQGRARTFAPITPDVIAPLQAKLQEEIARVQAQPSKASAGRLQLLNQYLNQLQQLQTSAAPAAIAPTQPIISAPAQNGSAGWLNFMSPTIAPATY